MNVYTKKSREKTIKTNKQTNKRKEKEEIDGGRKEVQPRYQRGLKYVKKYRNNGKNNKNGKGVKIKEINKIEQKHRN